ncbi:MAG: sporulation protein YqfD [Hespellia sp.]|nr:sporulation protein YqfD [Hespellia sp.]
MISKLLCYIKGYLLIRIRGDSIERFINLCRFQEIQLWGLFSNNHQYEMYLSISDFRKLRPIQRKTGIHIQIQKKYGLPFLIHRYSRRKLFFLGCLMFCLILNTFCHFIWNVQISGNQFYTDEVLKTDLAAHGIHPFIQRNNVNCERIVRYLRNEYHDIVWVSVSLVGTRLQIQIKENTEQELLSSADPVEQHTPTDLIASKAGTITEIITRNGIPQFHKGDSVKEGDILVSGSVPIKNDGGEIISYQAQTSDADILAETSYQYEDTLSHSYQKKIYKKREQYQFQIGIGNFLYIIHPLKEQKNQEIHLNRTSFSFFQQLQVPFYIEKKTARSYTFHTDTYTKEEVKAKLSDHFNLFCSDLAKKGVQITSNSVKIHLGVSASTATGTIYTIEKIGVPKESTIPEAERINTE